MSILGLDGKIADITRHLQERGYVATFSQKEPGKARLHHRECGRFLHSSTVTTVEELANGKLCPCESE
jgi:hypothetical protein